jgi:hypothetical protein
MKITVFTKSLGDKEALKPVMESLASQTFDPLEFEWLAEPEFSIEKAKGQLIVYLGEYTKANTSGLLKFWQAYEKEPEVFWTAPLAKTKDWKNLDWDFRAYEGVVDVKFGDWETEWSAAPKELLKKDLKDCKFKNLYDNPAIKLLI